ncbi:hypothetical protein ACS86_04290 [Vibrio alginolyticus]|nr:hypothetical protein ACS86_04290 [Vibrio alginolyticus]
MYLRYNQPYPNKPGNNMYYYYRGFKIQVRGNVKYVQLSKGRNISDTCSLRLKKNIDDIIDLNTGANSSQKPKDQFWKNQIKSKH